MKRYIFLLVMMLCSCSTLQPAYDANTAHRLVFNQVIFDLKTCFKEGPEAVCKFELYPMEFDRVVKIRNPVRITDVNKQSFPGYHLQLGQSIREMESGEARIDKLIIADQKTPLTVKFRHVDPELTEIKLLQLGVEIKRHYATLRFENIPISD